MAENGLIRTTVSKRWLKIDELELHLEDGWKLMNWNYSFWKMAENGWIETIVSKRWLKMDELELQFLEDGWKWMN